MVSKSAATRKDARLEIDPAIEVLKELRIIFHAVRNHFRSVETKVGVSGAQVWALSQIAASPGIGVGQLAKSMEVHQSTASNLVRALLEGGLIVVERGTIDRRSAHLRATARGMRILVKAPTPFTGGLPDALGRLSPATLARLRADLRKLGKELRADPTAAGVPLWTPDK